MNASASLPLAHFPTGVARILLVALVASAFLIGGTSGYIARGLGFSWPAATANTTTTTDSTRHQPYVIQEPPPYASPAHASTAPANGSDSDLTRAQPTAPPESKRASE